MNEERWKKYNIFEEFGKEEIFLVDGDVLFLYSLKCVHKNHNMQTEKPPTKSKFFYPSSSVIYFMEQFLYKLLNINAKFHLFFTNGFINLLEDDGEHQTLLLVIRQHFEEYNSQFDQLISEKEEEKHFFKTYFINDIWLDDKKEVFSITSLINKVSIEYHCSWNDLVSYSNPTFIFTDLETPFLKHRGHISKYLYGFTYYLLANDFEVFHLNKHEFIHANIYANGYDELIKGANKDSSLRKSEMVLLKLINTKYIENFDSKNNQFKLKEIAQFPIHFDYNIEILKEKFDFRLVVWTEALFDFCNSNSQSSLSSFFKGVLILSQLLQKSLKFSQRSFAPILKELMKITIFRELKTFLFQFEDKLKDYLLCPNLFWKFRNKFSQIDHTKSYLFDLIDRKFIYIVLLILLVKKDEFLLEISDDLKNVFSHLMGDENFIINIPNISKKDKDILSQSLSIMKRILDDNKPIDCSNFRFKSLNNSSIEEILSEFIPYIKKYKSNNKDTFNSSKRFIPHHFHSNQLLSLDELFTGKKKVTVKNSYWQEKRKLKMEQIKARNRMEFINSLQESSSVSPIVIVEAKSNSIPKKIKQKPQSKVELIREGILAKKRIENQNRLSKQLDLDLSLFALETIFQQILKEGIWSLFIPCLYKILIKYSTLDRDYLKKLFKQMRNFLSFSFENSDIFQKSNPDKIRFIIQQISTDLPFTNLFKILLDNNSYFNNYINEFTFSKSSKVFQCSIEYQMKFLAPELIRNKGTADDRVQFLPDAWQMQLLDHIDNRMSVVVEAPTSSGKTFICFYAMEKILRESSNGLIIYVAPTNAILDQVEAEIEARFVKKYDHTSERMVGIFTREVRRNIFNCQILVTVPQCLEILLLSPTAGGLTERIKYTIFDEIHCINIEEGEIWESVILLNESPIIGLSATLGDSKRFINWLRLTESMKGRELKFIQYSERYNDLSLSLYNSGSIVPLSQLSAYSLKDIANNRLSQTFRLLPEETIILYHIMRKVLGVSKMSSLSPENSINAIRDSQNNIVNNDNNIKDNNSNNKVNNKNKNNKNKNKNKKIVNNKNNGKNNNNNHNNHISGNEIKKDISHYWNLTTKNEKEYSTKLIEKLISTAKSNPDSCSKILNEFNEVTLNSLKNTTEKLNESLSEQDYLVSNLMDLCSMLKERKETPAIIFYLNKQGCHGLAVRMSNILEELEKQNKILKKVPQQLEILLQKKENLQFRLKKMKEEKETEDLRKELNDEIYGIENQMRQLESVDEKFAFPGSNHLPDEDDLFFKYGVSSELNAALKRGIGIHHGSIGREYRKRIEQLFRSKKLGIIFATGTLAFGINMPCKTVVFAGDSRYFSTMIYHQMKGRAGRRGFDNRGNVIFFGVPPKKTIRLIKSDLPSITGRSLLSCSYVLKILIKLNTLEYVNDQEKLGAYLESIKRVLTPLYSPVKSFHIQTKFYFLYCLEVLRELGTVDSSLNPCKIAGLIAHISYTEPSNFAFSYLFESGILEQFLSGLNSKQDRKEKLMIILCNLFCRIKIPNDEMKEELKEIKENKSPSILFLPKLPSVISDALLVRNNKILNFTSKCIAAFVTAVDCHSLLENDNQLPLFNFYQLDDNSTTHSYDNICAQNEKNSTKINSPNDNNTTTQKRNIPSNDKDEDELDEVDKVVDEFDEFDPDSSDEDNNNNNNNNNNNFVIKNPQMKKRKIRATSKPASFKPASGNASSSRNGSCLSSISQNFKIISSFAAISEQTEKFVSRSGMVNSLRNGLIFDLALTPISNYSNRNESYNAAIYDFWRHGQKITITRDNLIYERDFVMDFRDFVFILMALSTAANFSDEFNITKSTLSTLVQEVRKVGTEHNIIYEQ